MQAREQTIARLLEKAHTLPLCPGVYVMRDRTGRVIYVGKSKKLKNRVMQYFQNSEKNAKTARMVSLVRDFDYYLCDTEIEALSLENTLIKQYTPVILKMTISEGKVLLKLIDRETEYTAFQIIKDFRGGFVAGFWQMFAKMFGNNLKLEYEPETKDKVLEQIVTYYEMGWL